MTDDVCKPDDCRNDSVRGPDPQTTPRGDAPQSCDIEVSVVMPCLNEADTLENCIRKAQDAMRDAGIVGEVIVADNGSTDDSVEIARRMRVHVVHEKRRGYGYALMAGIAAAQGRFVIMGDADDSYDFREIPKFVDKLREGFEFAQGCRLPSGGGTVLDGAMPLLHRWIGNPLLTKAARWLFGVSVHDVYCGLRGFRKDLFLRLQQRCTGMEFATEMVIRSNLIGARTIEIPITLHPDGRTSHTPHLNTIRDGWRTLRLFMVYSPRWTFFIPGVLLVLLGLAGYSLAMPGLTISGATLDAHTLLFASLAVIMGYQAILFAFLAQIFAANEKLIPDIGRPGRLLCAISVERIILVAALAFLCGLSLLGGAVYQWWQVDFGTLEYPRTMRWVIPGVSLATLGFQSILAGFFLGVLQMQRTAWREVDGT